MQELLLNKEYRADILFFAASVALVVLYHLYLRYRLRNNPHYSFQGVIRITRTRWVSDIMADPSRTIVGVQTLRNSTMAATFFASTAILLIMGTLTLSGQSDKLTESWHLLNVLGSSKPGIWIAKVIFLLSDFMVAFFSFAMSVRLFHHVGYLLRMPANDQPGIVTPKTVALHLNRAGYYYSIGMRAYYLSIPLVFWLFGPRFMLFATVVLIFVLYRTDRAPELDQGSVLD